jgi:hypothetical protein
MFERGKPISFKEAINLANQVGIVGEEVRADHIVVIILENGDELHFESQVHENHLPHGMMKPPACTHYKVRT